MPSLRHVAAALVLLASCAARAEPPACLQTLTLQPGQPARIPLTGSSILIEEIGTDVDYRWNDTDTFTSVATPPDRLGFDTVPVRGTTLTLQTRAGQGGGQVRLSTCLDASELSFFSGLAELQRRSLENGKDAAQAALPPLHYLSRWPLSTTHAGWISSAYANVLASAGENNAAERMFLDSSRHWQDAGRPDRAAIALMAAGDNASRANRFDDARAWLTQARDELDRLGVTYYALRSASSLCTVLSRESRYRDAIACEEAIIPHWNVQQEKREASIREISAANLRLRFKELDQAEQHFLRAEAADSTLPPLVRSRLQIGLGNYALTQGDLPTAAKRFAMAAAQLGGKGLPTEQADLDLKLANLARLAGAWPERLRLLETAGARLSASDAPLRVAEIMLLTAEAQQHQGDATAALAAAQRAAALCATLANADCLELAALIETRAQITLGQTQAAQTKFAALGTGGSTNTASDRRLIGARLDLAHGNPQRALERTQSLPTTAADPEFQAEHALLLAEALARMGQRESGRNHLLATLQAQAAQAARWPSAALRISARERLAQLQSALFEQALAGDDTTIAIDDFAAIRAAIDAGAAMHLFAGARTAALPAALRASLSAAVAEGGFAHQRELFAALAVTDTTPTKAASVPRIDTTQTTGTGAATTLVIVPLGGTEHFHLLTLHRGIARRCQRWPIARYRDLVARFDDALDGNASEIISLQHAAEELHAAVHHCRSDTALPMRWHVVLVPGTPALPWAWIAASAPDAQSEPAITNTFAISTVPASSPTKPARLLLLDLDMPATAPLPFASREITVLSERLRRDGIASHHVRAAELGADAVLTELSSASVVHVIGHANPAAFGQLYQGFWYESGGKPSLLTYPEIAAKRSNTELVVLSACGTRANDAHKFGATARLAEAFIAAGARHVVAASNPLSDAAAPLWTEHFHNALWNGASLPDATRRARNTLRASPHFRAPQYWAGIEHFEAPGMLSEIR